MTTECAYCNHAIEIETVPAIRDDEAWAEIAEEHARDCEWVLTRAHRVECEPQVFLLDYANAREFVVAFYTSTACPAGDYAPLGNPDLDFVERRGLLDLTGTIDARGDWHWDGKGEPCDDSANSILKVHAYVSPAKYAELEFAE